MVILWFAHPIGLKIFETQYIIEDKIPKEKAIIGKFNGLEPLKDKPEKSDRILVMKNVEQ